MAIFPVLIWGRFQLIFHRKSKKSAIFLLPVCLAYWPRKHATCSATHVDHFRKFEVDTNTIAELQLCWCGYVTWPFNIGEKSNMAGHVGNPSTKFEDPTPIRSWLMSYDVRHRPLLTMRLEPLRMCRITWPVHRGQIVPKYLKSLTPICLFTMQPSALRSR